jgi:SM-20-related protein
MASLADDISTCAPDERLARATEFLRRRSGTAKEHSGSTLLDHLIGVEAILRDWGCNEATCLAGLFHSVYGTESFRVRTMSVSERPLLRNLIGDRGEDLAYRFSTLNTRSFIGQIIETAASQTLARAASNLPDDTADLLHIFVANAIEQMPRMPARRRLGQTEMLRRLRPALSPAAQAAIDTAIGADLPAPLPRIEAVALPGSLAGGEAAIRVMDDFVPASLRLELTSLTEHNIWRYGWKAADTQTKYGFWHSHFGGDNADKSSSCESELLDRPLMAPVVKLWHLVRDNLAQGQIPIRVYANAHTYGGDGHIHTDCDQPGHFTALYYAHDKWDANWGGETIFLDGPDGEIIKAVLPRPGRLVFFPGNIHHAARSLSRECPTMRSVIVIKTMIPSAP